MTQLFRAALYAFVVFIVFAVVLVGCFVTVMPICTQPAYPASVDLRTIQQANRRTVREILETLGETDPSDLGDKVPDTGLTYRESLILLLTFATLIESFSKVEAPGVGTPPSIQERRRLNESLLEDLSGSVRK